VLAGETLGHYRVLHTLGKGGMGEVYAAEDTKLHRTVALKILPGIFAADPAFRERFEREAQAVAALNHPNIVTIYSVEEDAGRPFITMEHVDGRPLSELMTRGGLPLDRILRISIEVADAMAAAQQRGITHRDLKPANIVIAADGRAKVLDFGLAKVRDAELAQAGEQVTRMSRELTGEGKILGTVAYMSPEQAEGKAVDPRSDIFSFGVVLHEMATGERPFKGDTNVSLISSIMKDTPRPVTDSNPALPVDFARIVRRCLAKDPLRRYQTALDLRTELEELKLDSGSSAAVASPRRTGMARSTIAWVAALLGVVAMALMAFFWTNRAGRASGPAASSGFTLDRIQRLTTTGTAYIAAISADGRYVVHVKSEGSAGGSLWTRQTATSSDVQIVAPQYGKYGGITISDDDNYVYYNIYLSSARASLYKVSVLGGPSTKILDDIDSPIAFSPDRKRFAFTRGSVSREATDLVIADADGGNAHALATSTAPVQFLQEGPAWSPDGKTFLLVASSSRPGAPGLVEAVDAQRGTTQTIGAPWALLRSVAWLPGGKSFLVTGRDLGGSSSQVWRVSYPSGERSRVTNDLSDYNGVSVSSDGRSIATVQTEVQAGVYVAEGPDREPRRVTGEAGRAEGTGGLAWMPDGRIVYTSTRSGSPQIWIVDGNGANAHQLTSQQTLAANPQVSPDGAWIYFASYENDTWGIFQIAPNGTGLKPLAATPGSDEWLLLPTSPDGKVIYFRSGSMTTPRLMRISTSGGAPEQVSKGFFYATDISPDGTQACGKVWDAAQATLVPAVLDIRSGAIEVRADWPMDFFYGPHGGVAGIEQFDAQQPLRVWPAHGASAAVTPPLALNRLTFRGAASRDGRIAFSLGQRISDVVLISAK
jgi:Tol biopolymer transport system component/predicted Ser/Thr protein kinase